MPEAVLDGRLGEICQRYMSDAPRAYAWPALLTIAGAKPQLKHAGQSLRGNLYTCLVGAVNSGKSSVSDRTLHVLNIDPGDSVLLKAKFGSAEALAQELNGQGGCTRLLLPDEWGHLLGKCAIEHSSFPTFLTTAFYEDMQRAAARKTNSKSIADSLFSEGWLRINSATVSAR